VIASELELAATHLLRAKEKAQLLSYSQEQIDRLDLLKRAVIKVRKELARERNRI
jgi:hypothetical protein